MKKAFLIAAGIGGVFLLFKLVKYTLTNYNGFVPYIKETAESSIDNLKGLNDKVYGRSLSVISTNLGESGGGSRPSISDDYQDDLEHA